MKKLVVAVILAISCLTLSACDQQQYDDNRGVGDAPPVDWNGKAGQDSSTKVVTGMPDGFPNIATSCVANGFRAFIQTRENASGDGFKILVDPNCKGFIK